MFRFVYFFLFLNISLVLGLALPAEGGWREQIQTLAGDGAVMAADAEGHSLFALNQNKPLVPASIFKIVTSAAALKFFGPAYHFKTEFRINPEGDLYLVGRGDPYLVSEELALIAERLKAKGLKNVRNILLDDSYFSPGLVLHGTSRSLNPYDAYNGAICVNFNTLFVRVDSSNNVSSAEPQTPLTDFARRIALKSGVKGKARINLAGNPETVSLYAGHLLKAFLIEEGLKVRGHIIRTDKGSASVPLLYRHRSRHDLAWLVKRLLKYSSNFMANQIFLTMGAERYGSPATVHKSRRVMSEYLAAIGLPKLHIEEGSGLSRRTRITAAQMISALHHFQPYRSLLQFDEKVWYKTGTLSDVKSVAGYIEQGNGQPLAFVIMLNGKGVTPLARQKILTLLKENLN
ncbi:MAG: D-alanyl-D-alanine carboxypeptidase [Deltaproteobacteria bacterium]|nr:D-alanyl-D-alanine carboxypeptidase [Deltaproteobacteria bacterium]MBW2053438.1 D-alanyl-D-alanine carboxypeptidase [Deltaproteobacteria bacterium]